MRYGALRLGLVGLLWSASLSFGKIRLLWLDSFRCVKVGYGLCGLVWRGMVR